MKTFPLSAEELLRELDRYTMEARVELNQILSRAMKLVIENTMALDVQHGLWKKSETTLPGRAILVLVAYKYRVDQAWRFEIARLANDDDSPGFWVRNDGEYVHEFKGTFWQELVGPRPSEPGTEIPGVKTEAPGVATEPPGVLIPGTVTVTPGVTTWVGGCEA